MGAEQLTVIADWGYFKNTEILAWDNANIKAIVAKSVTSNATADGRFGKDDFICDAKNDAYRCPAGLHALVHNMKRVLKILGAVPLMLAMEA